LLDADADRADLELRLIKPLLEDRARVLPFVGKARFQNASMNLMHHDCNAACRADPRGQGWWNLARPVKGFANRISLPDAAVRFH
jgi:hypothetical protein